MTVNATKRITSEARKFARFRVSTPVVFTWKNQMGEHQGEGVTRDISASSLFIWSQIVPPVDADLKCELLLPRMSPDSQELRVELIGRLTRVERRSRATTTSGFAVSSSRISVLTPEGTVAADLDTSMGN